MTPNEIQTQQIHDYRIEWESRRLAKRVHIIAQKVHDQKNLSSPIIL